MALSEDQKAMLRLLAQRGEQGYEDLSALLGISAAEVHEKALEAAAQLESEGIPAPAIPTPPGVAAATPETPEPEPPRQEPDPEPEPPADEPVTKPEPAEEKPAPAVAKSKPAARGGSPSSRLQLPESKGARFAIAANVVAVLAIVVIVLVSAGGDDSGDSGSGTSNQAESAEQAAAATPNLTQAVLAPVDGGDAEGRAIFGRIKKEVILQVQAEGLEPSPEGSSYTVWLYKSPRLALRIGSVNVGESGGIAAQFPLPTELLALIAGGAFDQIDISLTEDAAYKAEIAKSKKGKRLPSYVGEDVLRGPITGPAIEAAREAEREGKGK
jgi:hypothetical protein